MSDRATIVLSGILDQILEGQRVLADRVLKLWISLLQRKLFSQFRHFWMEEPN